MTRIKRRKFLAGSVMFIGAGCSPVSNANPQGAIAMIDAFDELCIDRQGRSLATNPMLEAMNEILVCTTDFGSSEMWAHPRSDVRPRDISMSASGRLLLFCLEPLRPAPVRLCVLDRDTGRLTEIVTGFPYVSAPTFDEASDRVFFFARPLNEEAFRPYVTPVGGGAVTKVADERFVDCTQSRYGDGVLYCNGTRATGIFDSGAVDIRTNYRRLNIIGDRGDDLDARITAMAPTYGSINLADIYDDGDVLVLTVHLTTFVRHLVKVGQGLQRMGLPPGGKFVRAALARGTGEVAFSVLEPGEGNLDNSKIFYSRGVSANVTDLALKAVRRTMEVV